MQAPQIQSLERLSTLIFADRISGDERGLAFPTSGFKHSALAAGRTESSRSSLVFQKNKLLTQKGVLLRSEAEPANTPLVEQARFC
jgi:hypothetical protein